MDDLSEHDPHTAHLLWQGPQDLSAEARIARVGEAWRIELRGPAFPLSENGELNLAVWDVGGKGVGGWFEAAPGMKQLHAGKPSPGGWLNLAPPSQ